MQRRAAAVYVAFFLLIATASYALIATAHEPTLEPGDLDQKRELQANQTFTVNGDRYTVANITASTSGGGGGGGHGGGGGSASVQRKAQIAPANSPNNTTEVSDKGNITLSNQTFFATFPNNNTLVLSQDFQSLEESEQAATHFKEGTVGLWGVTILSGLSAVLLIGLAYLPSRY